MPAAVSQMMLYNTNSNYVSKKLLLRGLLNDGLVVLKPVFKFF